MEGEEKYAILDNKFIFCYFCYSPSIPSPTIGPRSERERRTMTLSPHFVRIGREKEGVVFISLFF
jgi:hypothetical protein